MSVHHRLAAVWFADIVDYSDLSAENEVQALRLVRVFQGSVRDAVRRYGGRVVKYLGDGALAEFPSAAAAVASAGALRGAFGEAAGRAALGSRDLRIGVHIGEVAVADDGDLYGDGVNVAARIRQEAARGEIVASEDVYRQLRQWPDFEFESRGDPELKGVGRVHVYEVRVGADVEPEETGEAAGPLGVRGEFATLLGELRRRHVFRVAGIYLVVAWVVVQVANATFPPLHLPLWSLTLAVVVAIAGFPIAVLLAWVYEMTPQGVRRTRAGAGGAELGGRWRLAAAAAVAAIMALGWGLLRWAPWSRAMDSEAVTAAATALDPARLAVLYFDDLSPNGELEHVARGITEALIDELDRVESLEVVSRHGVRQFREEGLSLDTVAMRLGAGTVVDGSVGRREDRLEIQVRLVDASNMTQIASFMEERPESEIFSLIEDVAGDVSTILRQRLGREIRLQARRRSTENVEAWELVQRAERLREQATEASGDLPVAAALRGEADSLLSRAETLDPEWIDPLLIRGELAADEGTEPALMRGIEYAERALATRSREPRALALRGTLRHHLAALAGDSTTTAARLASAERDLRAAVAGDPTLASAWIGLAELLYVDKWELVDARTAAEQAYRADAFLLEEDHYRYLCEISIQLEDPVEARRWCAEGLKRYPDRAYLIQTEILRLASRGVEPDPARAWTLVDRMARLEHPDYNVAAAKMYVAMGLARAGLPDSAKAVAAQARRQASPLFEKYPELGPSFDYLEGFVLFLLGERQGAIGLFASTVRAMPEYRALLALDRWLQPLAGDPRFEAIVDRKRDPIFCRLLCEPPD